MLRNLSISHEPHSRGFLCLQKNAIHRTTHHPFAAQIHSQLHLRGGFLCH
jgi:hypothetical protein